ncbi:uncharacterized protein [Arachis hypogaea]|uniref:uncharacterized protein n=1 Tax=Arachis hypogaea TaxID=3818 RepID=UPI003B227853
MARVHCKNLVRIYKPSFFFLFETHTIFNNLKNFWDKLDFHCVGIEEAVGHRGGIWFLSSIANTSCVVIDQIDQCITVKVSVGNLIWLCSAVYGSPQFEKRCMLWDHLRSINSSHNGPWMAVGDFNEIVAPDESTCAYFSSHRASLLATTLDDCELFDLKVTGRRYTWYRAVQAGRNLAKRLDRALVNEAWMTMFPEGYSEILSRLHSDHCPILVRCHGSPRVKGSRPFRFQAAWATHPSYKHVISKAWNQEFGGVTERLKMVQQASLDFNSNIFGNIFVRKNKLEYQIDQIQRRLDVTDVLSLRIKEAELREDYNRLLLVHRLYVRDGSWSTDPDILQEEALSFYKSFFGTTVEVEVDCFGDVPMPTLSTEACARLIDPVFLAEVKLAVFSMSPFKAPGPDGFQAYFFKEYWEIVGTEIWNIVRSAFLGEFLNHSIMETLIVLIPKIDNPTFMKDFRPISLCNVVYKIITKVLTNQLRPFLPDIVSPLQGGFILGRGALDNNIVTKEILNFMKHTKSKKGTLAFKIDLEKAYDRVDWRLDSFTPRRGLRQGDPMSPYLFVLCMERLACYISHKVVEGVWKPVSVTRDGPKVSHLMFADDLLLFCQATKSQFLWKDQVDGRGLSLINRRTVITPKKFGGLGVRDPACVNISLLGKLVWQLFHCQDKPWVALLRVKYLRNEGVLDGHVPCNASHVWKSISKAFSALKDSFSWFMLITILKGSNAQPYPVHSPLHPFSGPTNQSAPVTTNTGVHEIATQMVAICSGWYRLVQFFIGSKSTQIESITPLELISIFFNEQSSDPIVIINGQAITPASHCVMGTTGG